MTLCCTIAEKRSPRNLGAEKIVLCRRTRTNCDAYTYTRINIYIETRFKYII